MPAIVPSLLIGLAAGVLSGLFGIGGGILIVPMLLLTGLAKSTQQATGTSLAALLFPVAVLGVFEYHRHGNINAKAAIGIAIGLFFGAWFGARMAHMLSSTELKRLFAVFLIIAAVRLLWTTKTPPVPAPATVAAEGEMQGE